MKLFNVIDNIKISVFYIMKMEHIKHKIEKLDNQLKHNDNYDDNEKYLIKEEKLKKWERNTQRMNYLICYSIIKWKMLISMIKL